MSSDGGISEMKRCNRRATRTRKDEKEELCGSLFLSLLLLLLMVAMFSGSSSLMFFASTIRKATRVISSDPVFVT